MGRVTRVETAGGLEPRGVHVQDRSWNGQHKIDFRRFFDSGLSIFTSALGGRSPGGSRLPRGGPAVVLGAPAGHTHARNHWGGPHGAAGKLGSAYGARMGAYGAVWGRMAGFGPSLYLLIRSEKNPLQILIFRR